jgi:hypothetical protein
MVVILVLSIFFVYISISYSRAVYGTDMVLGARHAALHCFTSGYIFIVACEENWNGSPPIFIYWNYCCQFCHFCRLRLDAYCDAHSNVNKMNSLLNLEEVGNNNHVTCCVQFFIQIFSMDTIAMGLDADYYYTKPWTRAPPYIIGVWLGWLLHVTKESQKRTSKVIPFPMLNAK